MLKQWKRDRDREKERTGFSKVYRRHEGLGCLLLTLGGEERETWATLLYVLRVGTGNGALAQVLSTHWYLLTLPVRAISQFLTLFLAPVLGAQRGAARIFSLSP